MDDISPKYIMNLINQINDTLWGQFSTYKNVKYYMQKWQKVIYIDQWHDEYNFEIIHKEDGNIDSLTTLHSIKDFELVIKIAIDLGIQTPGYIPAVSEIKNILKDNYSNIYDVFSKAYKSVEESPNVAIGLANSALESITKEILSDNRIKINYNKGDTLYKLTEIILKEIGIYPGKDIPSEINQLGSSLLSANKSIEDIRSSKTLFHGKSKNDIIIEDTSYAYFIVNVVSSIGLFLLYFYKQNYHIEIEKNEQYDDDLPF